MSRQQHVLQWLQLKECAKLVAQGLPRWQAICRIQLLAVGGDQLLQSAHAFRQRLYRC
jgi:hypothetical protein